MFRGGLRPGHRVLVSYVGDEWLHERLVLSLPTAGSICVCTPHWDMYVEDIADYEHIFIRGPRGAVPPDWRPSSGTDRAGKVVIFDNTDLADRLDSLLADGEASEPSTVAAVQIGPVAAGPLGGVVVAPVVAPGAVVAGPDGGPPDAVPWIAMESRCGYQIGDRVTVCAAFLYADGDRGLFTVGDKCLAVAKLSTWDVPAAGKADDDIRTLPVGFDGATRKTSGFSESVKDASESPSNAWYITGPRTTLWILQALDTQDQSPTRRHWWWRSALSLSALDPGVEEHQFLCEVLETGLAYDRLNLPDLQCFESICRRLQLWEEYYGEGLRLSEAGGSLGSRDADERSIFLGHQHGRGVALVAPALSDFVSSRLKEKSTMLKERRKAREERLAIGGGKDEPAGGGGDRPSRGARRAAAKAKGASEKG